jgi:hypothetical protein
MTFPFGAAEEQRIRLADLIFKRSASSDGTRMNLTDIAFGVTDWPDVAPTEHPGETGTATWRTRQFGPLRVRMVEYTPGYLADHWCTKGHVLLCVAGELDTELADGRRFHLTPGQSYQVADDAEPHRSSTPTGARLFIVD